MNATARLKCRYQFTVQYLDAGGWCCWISNGGRTLHCVEGAEAADVALTRALAWADANP